jgi:hypothetical protein
MAVKRREEREKDSEERGAEREKRKEKGHAAFSFLFPLSTPLSPESFSLSSL